MGSTVEIATEIRPHPWRRPGPPDVSGPSPSPERPDSRRIEAAGHGLIGHGSGTEAPERLVKIAGGAARCGVSWVFGWAPPAQCPRTRKAGRGFRTRFRSVRDRTLVLGRYSCKSQRHLRTPGPKNHEG
jgi:hypothetical protein